MRRRDFLKVAGGLAASTSAGHAQAQKVLPVVAVLLHARVDVSNERLTWIITGLKDIGLIEGRDYRLEVRIADGDFGQLPSLARELEPFDPVVFVVGPSTVSVVQKLKTPFPIVFASISADPIAGGFAKSFARPGGMITGNVLNALGGEFPIVQKRIVHLKEMAPTIRQLGIIGPKASTLNDTEIDAVRKVGVTTGIEISVHRFSNLDDLEFIANEAVSVGSDAFYISGDPILFNNMSRVMPILMSTKLPAAAPYIEWSRAGLLLSYSADINDSYRRAGNSAAKIVLGAAPGEIPIGQATKFLLCVNLRTARDLKINVPSSIIAFADEIID
jgi:putative ABC transport system substrate-binding protein